ncbi:MAG: RNA polymerase subunit sigma-70 [Evtepia sp.]|nr:RNA polymerase subunit sigma-70 [Evtepia sp.]MDY3014373.1 RNA polymerase subunit sigma-70 [Evtepia sp.]
MTNEERTQIIELQRKGYGYKQIATITGLPQNTVKPFCSRHPAVDDALAEAKELCRNCKKPLEQTLHKRKKVFCSDACRMAWWNTHPEKVERKAYYTIAEMLHGGFSHQEEKSERGRSAAVLCGAQP